MLNSNTSKAVVVLFNSTHLPFTFFRDNLLNEHRLGHPGKPLAGLRILDVGCGGGLLTEVRVSLFCEKDAKRVQIRTCGQTILAFSVSIPNSLNCCLHVTLNS